MSNRQSRIRPVLRSIIYQKALEYPRMPRELVAKDLVPLIEELKERVPDKETLMREISYARNHEPQDDPWHVVPDTRISHYSISPEALPAVLRVWESETKENRLISSRQARWVERLFYVFKEGNFYDTDPDSATPILATMAKRFAELEKATELARNHPRLKLPGEEEFALFVNDCILNIILTLAAGGVPAYEEMIKKAKEAQNERQHHS